MNPRLVRSLTILNADLFTDQFFYFSFLWIWETFTVISMGLEGNFKKILHNLFFNDKKTENCLKKE